VFTVGLGEYGNANPGNATEGEFNIIVVDEALMSPIKLKPPLIFVDPVIVVEPEISRDWVNGFT
jgi:hypothetical protein